MTYYPDSLIESRFRRGPDEGVVSANERAILRLIWRNAGISRSEITAHTDLTQQSVHRILDQLVERGIVTLGAPKPARGQPSPTLKLEGKFAYCCGIALNTDVIGICIMDLSGRTIVESTIANNNLPMREALDQISAELRSHQTRQALSPDRLLGIGFGISGYFVGGTRYNAPLPLHEWSLIELGPLLSEEFKKPVWVHNSTIGATIAESMFGVGRFIKNFAYLGFYYGFGGGLIVDGDLLRGGNGNGGKLSGMFDDEEHGHRPAMQFLMQKIRDAGVDIPSIEYIRRNFDRNWPGVADWVAEVEPAYNRVVNALSAIADPQAIVFGGQIPPSLAQMLIDRTRIFGRPRYGVPVPRAKLVISELRGDAAAQGAAVFPFREQFY